MVSQINFDFSYNHVHRALISVMWFSRFKVKLPQQHNLKGATHVQASPKSVVGIGRSGHCLRLRLRDARPGSAWRLRIPEHIELLRFRRRGARGDRPGLGSCSSCPRAVEIADRTSVPVGDGQGVAVGQSTSVDPSPSTPAPASPGSALRVLTMVRGRSLTP